MQSIYLLDPNFAAKGSLPQHLVDLRDLGFDAVGTGSTGSDLDPIWKVGVSIVMGPWGYSKIPQGRWMVCHGKSQSQMTQMDVFKCCTKHFRTPPSEIRVPQHSGPPAASFPSSCGPHRSSDLGVWEVLRRSGKKLPGLACRWADPTTFRLEDLDERCKDILHSGCKRLGPQVDRVHQRNWHFVAHALQMQMYVHVHVHASTINELHR